MTTSGKDDVVTLLGFLIEIADLCGRILQVTVQGDDVVACCGVVAGIQRTLLSEVTTQEDAFHMFVRCTDVADNLATVVRAAVFYQYNLITVSQSADSFCDLCHELP